MTPGREKGLKTGALRKRSQIVRVHSAQVDGQSHLREIWDFRYLVANLVSRDLKVRYKRSVLGFLWTMLNPLLMMMVYTIVFSQLMRFPMKSYAVYLLAGLIPWNAFSQTITIAQTSITDAADLIRKMRVPMAVFPLSKVAANAVNFFLSLVPLFIVMFAVGHEIPWTVVFLPAGMLIITIAAAGLALFLASLTVFFRDMLHLSNILILVWFFLSPIIYPLEQLPEAYRDYWKLNPMTHVLEIFHDILYQGVVPGAITWLVASCFSVLILLFGWWFFHWNDKRYVHYL
jgi:ABC-2 type transport system permease protein